MLLTRLNYLRDMFNGDLNPMSTCNAAQVVEVLDACIREVAALTNSSNKLPKFVVMKPADLNHLKGFLKKLRYNAFTKGRTILLHRQDAFNLQKSEVGRVVVNDNFFLHDVEFLLTKYAREKQ